jgi:phospholipid-binding lipoprotein MlaA
MVTATLHCRAGLVSLVIGLAIPAMGAFAAEPQSRVPGLSMAAEPDATVTAADRLESAAAMVQNAIEHAQQSLVDPLLSSYADVESDLAATETNEPDARLSRIAVTATDRQLAAAIQAALETEDPLEPFNRTMFGLNNGVRTTILNPITKLYLNLATPPVQAGVRNVFANLREPLTLVSNVIEGRMAEAGTAAARFGINSTVGVLGFYDPASRYGYRPHPRDLEEALCVYGLPSGPYMVLPIFGPGTIRDAAGRLITVFAYSAAMGPGVYIPYRLTDIAIRSIDTQAQIDRLDATTGDAYSAQRMLYLSLRALDCGQRSRAESEFFTK